MMIKIPYYVILIKTEESRIIAIQLQEGKKANNQQVICHEPFKNL